MFRPKSIYATEQGAAQFERILHQHQAMVFSIALRILGDRMAAEDASQEVFIQLYAVKQEWQSPEHLTAWLRRTTVHRAIDALRRVKARPECDLSMEPAFGTRDSDPIFAVRCKELLGELSAEARAVMVLRYQEDLTPAEIASVLNVPVTTVKSHLKRSLESLRAKLGVRRQLATCRRNEEAANG